jgi:arylsulfatase A-like enzyme
MRYGLLLSSALLLLAVARSAAAPINLVIIMTDDQGAWSMGCYGNPEAHTPALDCLAAGGVRLTRAFATIPVCSPSRATFFTGRLASQHGIHDWIKHENVGPRARYCLEGEVLLSDVLAKHGYTCGLSGKWHLGDSLNPHASFSYWFAMPQGGSNYNDAPMCWQGKTIETKGYVTDRITDRAIEFLDQNKERPFFLNVQYNAPHTPWNYNPPELLDLFKDTPFDSIPKVPLHLWAIDDLDRRGRRETLRQYFALVAGVDRGVARIIEQLKRLDLLERTLVVFTSDQGYCLGHHGVVGKGNGTNPRNMYDTSLRVPMIFYHPGRLTAGRTSDVLLSAYDFVPTLLDYLGLPPSPGRNLPGRSAVAALTGATPTDWPDAIFGEYGHTRMIRTGDWKYVHRADGGPLELYDLTSDPGETHNLAKDREHRQQLVALRTRLFEWFDRYVEAGADPIGQEYLLPADR